MDNISVKKIVSCAAASILLFGSVAGCGASSAVSSSENTEGEKTSVYTTAEDQSFEEAVQIPGILQDQVGYKTGSDKTVVFKGKEVPTEFYIKDAATGETVYEGEIISTKTSTGRDESYAMGRFTDFQQEGTYYIYADPMGESYDFKVGEDVYGELFDKAAKKFYINRCGTGLSERYAGDNAHSACHTAMAHLQESPDTELDVTGGWHMDEQAGRDTALGSRIAENLLVAYEMNQKAFTDDTDIPESGNGIPDILDEIRYEVDWLLKMQDQKTGGEYASAITKSGAGDVFAAPVVVTPVSMDATISFASMMARFSYFYQQYDPDFATTCLRAADRAWTCYLNNQKVTDSSGAFKAAAQLYRATGAANYNEVLEQFFAKKDFMDSFESDENIFLGSVTYLSTSQPVDMDRCGVLMKALMKKSEAIAKRASASSFLVSDDSEDESFDRILDDMRSLAITNHIIFNHEYTTIIENHAHYLLGMNPKAVNYLTEDTDRTYQDAGAAGVMNDPEKDALLIILFSAI
jgi:endoglucanase